MNGRSKMWNWTTDLTGWNQKPKFLLSFSASAATSWDLWVKRWSEPCWRTKSQARSCYASARATSAESPSPGWSTAITVRFPINQHHQTTCGNKMQMYTKPLTMLRPLNKLCWQWTTKFANSNFSHQVRWSLTLWSLTLKTGSARSRSPTSFETTKWSQTGLSPKTHSSSSTPTSPKTRPSGGFTTASPAKVRSNYEVKCSSFCWETLRLILRSN